MVTVCALPGGTARIRKVYSIATSDAIVLNYLHVLGDSDYKLSIDKSPIYSIIYINKCADGKKYHRDPTVQRAAVWCKAVSAPWREIVPEQPAEGVHHPCKQRRLQPLQCRTLLEVRERVCTARQREWYRRELEGCKVFVSWFDRGQGPFIFPAAPCGNEKSGKRFGKQE